MGWRSPKTGKRSSQNRIKTWEIFIKEVVKVWWENAQSGIKDVHKMAEIDSEKGLM